MSLMRTQPGIIGRAAAPPAQSYFPNGVVFDGTNDYLSRGSVWTNAVDSGLWTFSVAVKLNAIGIQQRIIRADEGTNIRFHVQVLSTNEVHVLARNPAAVEVLQFQSTTTLSTGQWYAIMFSIDLSDPANRHLFIDDVESMGTVTTYGGTANDVIGFTLANSIAVGARPSDGGQKLNGELADFWHESGRYVDFSVESNRRKFFNASNCLVDKGSDGSTPFGAVPIAYFGDDNDETNWHLNNAGNGDMTVNGALGASSADPCGE